MPRSIVSVERIPASPFSPPTHKDVWPGTLLPELALLPRLEVLEQFLLHIELRDPIPPEWGAPGAFPRLRT